MTLDAKKAAVQEPAMAGADGAHGRKRRRKRPPCAVPGCTTRPKYVCVHYEANSPIGPSAHADDAPEGAAIDPAAVGHRLYRAEGHIQDASIGTSARNAGVGGGGGGGDDLHWFCKAHKCRHCMRVDDWDAGADRNPPRPYTPDGPVDAARIADTARAALVRLWQDGRGAADPYTVYGFQTILELCGPDHGEVRVCACGHTLSSHYVGFGRCMDCPTDSPCRAMRWRKERSSSSSPSPSPSSPPPSMEDSPSSTANAADGAGRKTEVRVD